MPVDTRHPEWDNKEYSWFLVRHAVDGQSSIKRQNSLFLPIPTGMEANQNNPSSLQARRDDTSPERSKDYLINKTPNWHHNVAYSAYKARAQFPDITKRTLRGLSGVATRKDPQVTLPTSMQYMVDECATVTGLDLEGLFKLALSEVLQTGRFPLVLDVDEANNRPIIATYTAESFINWNSFVLDSKIETKFAVFNIRTRNNEEDMFNHDEVDDYICLKLVTEDPETGVKLAEPLYVVSRYDETEYLTTVVPNIQGQTLNRIPLVVIGSTNLDLKPDIVPLEGIADIATHIYMKNADIGQSQFMTANPTMVYTGIDGDDAPKVVGPTNAIVLPTDANAFYVETSGTGIASMQESVNDLFDQARSEGGELLGGTKKIAETEATAKLRQEAAGATLSNVVETVGKGIEEALKMAAEWMGENPDDVSFKPNMQFSEHTMPPEELAAMLNAWTNKAISYETYYNNLQKAGVTPGDRTAEEERTKIDTEAPQFLDPVNPSGAVSTAKAGAAQSPRAREATPPPNAPPPDIGSDEDDSDAE